MLALSSTELGALISKLEKNSNLFLEKTQACEQQLNFIETKVNPIQKSTYLHAEKKRIYEQRYYQIEKINSYLTVANSVQAIIEVDLSFNGFSKQKTLMDVLDRLAEARGFLIKYEKKIATAAIELKVIEQLYKVCEVCLYVHTP